jgi:ankyrin repeat protein
VNRRQRKRAPGRLVHAATWGGAHVVEALLRAGADPNVPDREGTTALYRAAVAGDEAMVCVLLAAGADPDLESVAESEGLPICAAASWGYAGVVRELLAHGADPNRREDRGEGMAPLDWALRNGDENTADVLRAAGAATTEWTAAGVGVETEAVACELTPDLVRSEASLARRGKARRRWKS